ncbi:hypothetical protein ABZ502_34135, partial [Streptomyces abikoensis]|uniref:hypothetical protein n=1 Tax=Streptomyces abikoensis TaxID=97398 RepID=UPI00340ED25E
PWVRGPAPPFNPGGSWGGLAADVGMVFGYAFALGAVVAGYILDARLTGYTVASVTIGALCAPLAVFNVYAHIKADALTAETAND